MYYIGVDIGGMSIKIGLVDKNGKILYDLAFKTEKVSPEKQTEKIAENIFKLLKENNIDRSEILGVGVGCPGTVNPSDGVVIYADNLNWSNFNVKRLLEKLTGFKVQIGNDADVATIAEILFGSAKGYKNAILITIGTGVGGGIVIEQKLYNGTKGVVAELGHITLIKNGRKCNCGRRGCLEQYASATALIRQTKMAMRKNKASDMWKVCDNNLDNVNGKTAFISAKNGDKTAIEVVNKFISFIGEGLLDYCNIFRPDVIIIGGGISKEGSYLTDKIYNYLKQRDFGYPGSPETKVITATLGNSAGIIGSASLVF